MTIQKRIQKLIKGNQRYVANMPLHMNRDEVRRNALVKGQNPFAIIISCADSRVVPEFIFDAGLGDLFVIRTAGNVANSSTIENIELALSLLETNLIIVLGHQNCGAVKAAKWKISTEQPLSNLLSLIEPAVQACGLNASTDEIIKLNVLHSCTDLTQKSTEIQHAVSSNSAKIIPAYYNLDTGIVDFL